MGREATVECRWAQESGLCKVLLESQELVVRGAFRRRVPITDLTEVTVESEELRFKVNGEIVSLVLGPVLAERWAKAIATPPPTLASKLGISSASHLRMLGEVESEELQAAIAAAGATGGNGANLILVSARTALDLEHALNQLSKRPSDLVPLWVVYPKGEKNGFGETTVREVLRQRGFIDTKIASVSSKLTALRFIWRGQ